MNSIVSRFQVSLFQILALMALIGMAVAALTRPHYLWAHLVDAAVVGGLALCAALAIAAKDIPGRASPLAFIAAVCIHQGMRLSLAKGESPFVELVMVTLYPDPNRFASPWDRELFVHTLNSVISLFLGVICGWIARSMSGPTVESSGRRT